MTGDGLYPAATGHNGILLGLGRIPSERIDRGVRKLASVMSWAVCCPSIKVARSVLPR
jgi:hypothetical protein